jgi:hypothetical protein
MAVGERSAAVETQPMGGKHCPRPNSTLIERAVICDPRSFP